MQPHLLDLSRPVLASNFAAAINLLDFRMPAGFPSPADDHMVQRCDLIELLSSHPQATYFMRVRGDSMLPHQPLIYSSRDAGMSQNTKRRVLETGAAIDYRACDSLQAHATQLYKRAGIKGSSHSERRTFAGKVLASTGDMATVAQLLGHSSIDCSQRYVDVNSGTLQAMFADAV